MSTIEFATQIEDSTIHIPQEYQGQIRDVVRVIILAPDHGDATDMIEQLLAHPIELAGFVPLKRDEANEHA